MDLNSKYTIIGFSQVEHTLKDRISMLPDEILILILSLFSLKEAAVTSVLSRRWMHLWAYISRLNFDATEALAKIHGTLDMVLLERERHKYVSWVNQVVSLRTSPTVEELTVSFDLDKSSKSDIDRWLKFALPMRAVHVLVLDLSRNVNRMSSRPHTENYTFPYEMVSQIRGSTFKNLSSNSSIMRSCSFGGLQFLKALCLKSVNVSGDVLECFLSDCPVLEQLCVHGSGDLLRLKVVGTSLKLKYLEICHCRNIESLEIRNVKIVSFTYWGHKKTFVLENVPLLVELSISGIVSRHFQSFYPLLSNCLPQLETLMLRSYEFKVTTAFKLSAYLPNLKRLVLRSYASGDVCLLGYTSFIKVCPNLQKFVLQLDWISPSIDKREVIKAREGSHQHLEEVEVAGYYGRTSDLEYVVYFLESAVTLKKIVIDPHDQMYHLQKSAECIKNEKKARARAKMQLEGKVPADIELVIL